MNCEPQPAERNGIGLFMEGGPAVDQFASRRIREQHQYQMDGARALQRSRDLPIKTRVVTRRKRVESELPAAKGFYQRFGKRAFDATFSLIFLIAVGSWLYPLVAIAIRLDSRGPVFFRQQRVGRSEEHTSELQSLMRISYAVFCLQ